LGGCSCSAPRPTGAKRPHARARGPDGRIWFVLYTMFTLGNGDYTPNGGAYQLAGGAAVASGMSLITLAVTYLLSVISAVTQKRSFAGQVSSFGESPESSSPRPGMGTASPP